MNKKQQRPLVLAVGMFTTGLLILIGAWLSTVTPARAGASALTVDHQLLGEIKFNWASTGDLATAMQTVVPTATVLSDLGAMDLGIWLQDGAGTVSGYVDLDNTLVMTTEHTIDLTLGLSTTQTAVGPALSGTFDGSNLELLSELFVLTTQSGETVERQFKLSGTVVDGVATGEYRETVVGMTRKPTTIVGGFSMSVVPGTQVVPTAVQGLGFSAEIPTVALTLTAIASLLIVMTAVTNRRNRRVETSR